MDPRAEHTRAALFTAVLTLATHKPIHEISVKELAEAAGVNRSSFYQHFEDREDLLASAIESLETTATRVTEAVQITDLALPPTVLIKFAQHFADYAGLYRQTLGPHGSARVATRVRARTIALVCEGIELSHTRQIPEVPLEIEAAGTAGAILGVIETWLSQEPLASPETAASWIWHVLARQ